MADTKHRTVLVAVDGSKHSYEALQWFVKNFYVPGDTVFLTYGAEAIASDPRLLVDSALAESDVNPVVTADLLKSHEREVQMTLQKIENMAQELKLEHIMWRLSGSPGEAILKAAADQEADLIVCGSRGMGLVRRTILGSVSDFLLHHSKIPVVVCKHPDDHRALDTNKS